MLILYSDHVSILYLDSVSFTTMVKNKIILESSNKTRIESKSTNLMTLDGLFNQFIYSKIDGKYLLQLIKSHACVKPT